MDFSNRNAQAQPAQAPAPSAPAGGNKRSSKGGRNWGPIAFVAGIVVVAILIVCLIVGIMGSGDSGKAEAKFVDNNKLQAVFLNTGQVYFGNIKTLNSKYFVVTNIYYLQTSSNGSSTTASNSNTSVSLVKLGCELHEPYDQMVINRDQVTFWENLQDNGQVAKAVSTFEKQNPNGQKCADQSSSASTNSGSSTQNAGSSNSGSTTTGSGTSTTNP